MVIHLLLLTWLRIPSPENQLQDVVSFSPGLCFAAPPPSASIPHVCGWIPHAAAWLGCKPLIDSFQPHWALGNPAVLTAHPRAPRPEETWAGDPEDGLCHPKALPPELGRLGSALGDSVPSFGSLGSVSSCRVPPSCCCWPLSLAASQ